MAKNTNQSTDSVTPVDPAKAEAKAKAQKAKNEARARVQTFLKDNAEQLGGLKADIELFLGAAPRAAKSAPRTINSELRDAFIAEGSLTEMDIFKRFRIGRPEMVAKCRVLVLTPNPEDRVWVKFDEATETYNVAGQGAEPPEGWTGYVPSAKMAAL